MIVDYTFSESLRVDMKIGFSFGRCVRDIVKGDVKIDDVLCIIARTHMVEKSHVEGVIREYLLRPKYLAGLPEDKCYEVGLALWQSGRVLEPRANGSYAMSVPSEYVWMDLFPTVPGVETPAVKEAWETYRMLITLTEQLPENDVTGVTHSAKITEQPPINSLLKDAV